MLSLSSPDRKLTPRNKAISGAWIKLEVYPKAPQDLAALYEGVTLYFSDSIEEGKTYKSYKVYSKQYTYLDGVKALRLDISRGEMV